MIRRFDFSAALKLILVGVLAGVSSFMFMPLILSGVMSTFTASALGVVIALPLIMYFLNFTGETINFKEYISERQWYGVVVDFLMTFLGGLAPGVILLYFQLSLGILPPVPVASSVAVGVFVGYSAFMFRNRDLFGEDKSDIVL